MAIIAGDRKFAASAWGWEWTGSLPFNPLPPLDDPALLDRYFQGRGAELDNAIRTVFYGGNLMVRGSWGVGKTAFILALLGRLRAEAQGVGERLLRALAPADPEARKVLEALTGRRVTRERGGEAKTKVKPGALVRLVLDVEGEIGGGLKRSEHAGRGYGKIVVVVDDLDKREPREIRQVLDEAKALLRGGRCRFVFTGRALVAPADDFSPLVLELFQDTHPPGTTRRRRSEAVGGGPAQLAARVGTEG